MVTQDMKLLCENLFCLVDNSEPLSSRVQAVKDDVDGLGKATLFAILLTSDPTEYGVWNNRSEETLKQLGIWPEFKRGTSFREKYAEVNSVLQRLGTEIEMDMWALDARLGFYLRNGTTEDSQPSDPGAEFAKEKHLKEYLISHWEQTAIGKD